MRQKLKITSYHRPALVRWKGWTRIVAGSITAVNGKSWNHTYVAIKGEDIQLSDIDWTPSTVPKNSRQKPSTKKIKGSAGKVYIITTHQNGKQTCTCLGYQYRRFCKHTGAK